MKYEMIFGDERLFFDAQKDCEMAEVMLWHDCFGPNFVSLKELSRMNSEGSIPHGSVVLAMRRIIADPKRWTWEDKMAGRLPEVGSEVILRTTGEIATINAANKNMVCLTFSDGGFSPFNVERIDPIESPEEKAQREEDEFVDSESFFIDVCTMSGPMKAAYKQGARAAYRKLKGGER